MHGTYHQKVLWHLCSLYQSFYELIAVAYLLWHRKTVLKLKTMLGHIQLMWSGFGLCLSEKFRMPLCCSELQWPHWQSMIDLWMYRLMSLNTLFCQYINLRGSFPSRHRMALSTLQSSSLRPPWSDSIQSYNVNTSISLFIRVEQAPFSSVEVTRRIILLWRLHASTRCEVTLHCDCDITSVVIGHNSWQPKWP